MRYKDSAGVTLCNAIVNQYADWTKYDLDNEETSYIETLSVSHIDNNNETTERPSLEFKRLWSGLAGSGVFFRETLSTSDLGSKNKKWGALACSKTL